MTDRETIEWLPWKGDDTACLWACVGLYRVFLGHDGECWSWRIDIIGEREAADEVVEEAQGFVSGDLARAQARAVGVARMLSEHTEEDYRERHAPDASKPTPDLAQLREQTPLARSCGAGLAERVIDDGEQVIERVHVSEPCAQHAPDLDERGYPMTGPPSGSRASPWGLADTTDREIAKHLRALAAEHSPDGSVYAYLKQLCAALDEAK